MTIRIENGNCLELMKNLDDKSVDLFICDLPYGETICKWDIAIDMVEFWKEFKRIRKSKKTACIHFCSTKFGYTLIKSNEAMFKMDMVWKKRNKTGGLQSRKRPMRNHEMVYFFYEQAPKYNRDKYHKRIQAPPPTEKKTKVVHFDPKLPASVLEESDEDVWGTTKFKSGGDCGRLNEDGSYKMPYDPPNPPSIFESTNVFIGKRHHQTEKPQDILEFFIKYWSDEGDTILDPTMGSGSTGVACKGLNRNFIGFELNDKIYKVAEERINKTEKLI